MLKTLVLAFVVTAANAAWPSEARAQGEALVTAVAQRAISSPLANFDGTVEAVRQTVLAAQVAGAVVRLDVKVGDHVKAGQVLLRLDARAAEQNAAAGDAQVLAARAGLEVATQEYERQKQLYAKNYISQAALQRAESSFKATRAQLAAQGAQAEMAKTQSGLHVVHAPFAGIVADVPVSLGDMAMPGRALLTLYDPSVLRVTAAVPQSVATQLKADAVPRVELPGLPAAKQWPQVARWLVLPTIDSATHTAQVRVDLPQALAGVVPGMFARIWLPTTGSMAAAEPPITVPQASIVRRAEMTGVYIVDASGRPTLRQVRLGRPDADRMEILSGVTAGERVVTNPLAAARIR